MSLGAFQALDEWLLAVTRKDDKDDHDIAVPRKEDHGHGSVQVHDIVADLVQAEGSELRKEGHEGARKEGHGHGDGHDIVADLVQAVDKPAGTRGGRGARDSAQKEKRS